MAREFQLYKTIMDDDNIWTAVEDLGTFENMIHVIEYSAYESLKAENAELKAELARITCGFCGQLFERDFNELKEHITVCVQHPLQHVTKENARLRERIEKLREALKEITRPIDLDNSLLSRPMDDMQCAEAALQADDTLAEGE